MTKNVYIHIPFCSNICFYCDFAKMKYVPRYVDKYLEALKLEITQNYKGENVNTIYIGGGTPTSLTLNELEKLFDIIKLFNYDDSCEITIEANPENLELKKLKYLFNVGVNRLSIGVQTFNDDLLKDLNRKHTSELVYKVISDAKNIGFNNINVDLIYGLNNQTMEDLIDDINKFINLDISHISIYSLILEENSVFGVKGYNIIDQDLEADMYSFIIQELEKNGFNHYEISNFSKDGYESKHNLIYWDNKNYYGFGLGAHYYINNIRGSNTRLMGKYMSCDFDKQESKLTPREITEEHMFLGLRKIKGISLKEFNDRYNNDIFYYYKDQIEELLDKKLIKIENDYLSLTTKGLFLANDVMTEFLL